MNIITWPGLTPYAEGLQRMEDTLAHTLNTGEEAVIFCEHEAILTIGTSGSESDLGASKLPFAHTGRGGKVTYHGPGQRVVYPIISLKRFHNDIRAYVRWLEEWIIATLATFGIEAEAGSGDETGVWVPNVSGNKIAALGVRVRKGVAYHGIALNLNPNLAVYKTFTPCGITQKGVTSLHAQSVTISMEELDAVLKQTFLKNLPPHPSA